MAISTWLLTQILGKVLILGLYCMLYLNCHRFFLQRIKKTRTMSWHFSQNVIISSFTLIVEAIYAADYIPSTPRQLSLCKVGFWEAYSTFLSSKEYFVSFYPSILLTQYFVKKYLN